MNVRIIKNLIATGSLILLASTGLVSTAHAQGSGLPWVGTWSAAPAEFIFNSSNVTLGFDQQTFRQVIHTTLGGTSARIHLSNIYGTAPLTFSDVHIAVNTGYRTVNVQTDKAVTFGGATSITIPSGQEVFSDPIAFTVAPVSDVAISFYLPGTTPLTTVDTHVFTETTESITYTAGDQSAAATLPGSGVDSRFFFLTGLDVQNTAATGTLVPFGASITDGYHSSNNSNHRWPNYLAQRFATAGLNIGILNQGIAGAGILEDSEPIYGDSGLHRFNRDVVSQPGTRWTILSDFPINDLNDNPTPTTSQLTTAYQTLITQAHAQQIKLFCSTLTPFAGENNNGTPINWTPAKETIREAINTWIRSANSGCDGVIDMDTAVHDPNNPTFYLPAYDSGDGLHPNDAGYQAMAAAVDLSLFMSSTPLAPVVAPTGCGTIKAGQVLTPGASLKSCDNRFNLTLQTDGNLALYFGTTVLWTSATNGKPSAQAVLEPTGNFIITDSNGNPLWATNSDNNPGSTLSLQNDGNLVMYTTTGHPVWNTYTNGH
ncbi:GDSL-type esterase/lipase family protein [Granulicella sp. S190]|uniref:GDSL-type esterase/lipase family protein n=1 Tax=Granulicella sp. S190 TaxID=1747226 RepID=UPI00131E7DCD|nr:GDSL-type esterase/lipase family protein [Granulicella sp. S190]